MNFGKDLKMVFRKLKSSAKHVFRLTELSDVNHQTCSNLQDFRFLNHVKNRTIKTLLS